VLGRFKIARFTSVSRSKCWVLWRRAFEDLTAKRLHANFCWNRT